MVVAGEGSEVSGSLIAVRVPEGPINDEVRRQVPEPWRAAIAEALRRFPVDLIHFHALEFYQYLPPEGPAVLATLHLPPSFYPREIFELSRPRTWLNCVSEFQCENCPPSRLLVGSVPNGVPLELLQVRNGHNGHFPPRSDYVLAVGRICPEKGFHLAVDAAEKVGVPFYLAGKLFPYPDHIRYWQEQLQPRLRPPHRFLGPVGMSDKARLMSSARCVLIPSLVAETSSLVAMESLACGTPVVAFPAGALRDKVEDGRTGFLVSDSDQMAQAILAVDRLDRGACRRVAQQRFSSSTMVERYVDLYHRLIQA